MSRHNPTTESSPGRPKASGVPPSSPTTPQPSPTTPQPSPTTPQPSPTTPQPSPPVDFGELLSGLLNSLSIAKQRADVASISLTQSYSQDKILRNFSIPIFNLQELEIDLRFAIQKVERDTNGADRIPRILVNVDSPTLSSIRTESLSNAKLKITPANLRIYQSEDKQVVVPES